MSDRLEGLRKRAAEIAGALADSGAVEMKTAVSKTPVEKLSPMRKGEFRVVEEERDMNVAEQVIMQKADKGDEALRRLQNFNDDCLILSAATGKDVSELRFFRNAMGKTSPMRKSMDTLTASEGLEWTPTNFSAEWTRFVDLELKVVGLFRRMQMPTDPYKLPYQASQITVYHVAQQTTDAGTKINASFPGTGNFQLDAKKIAARVPFSVEFTEDSIVPVLPMLREELGHAIGRGLEDAVVNGDTDTPHFDYDVTAGSTDRRTLVNGLRRHAVSNGDTLDISSFTPTTARNLRALMGKYGVDPSQLAWVASPSGYMKGFMNLADVITLEKYGSQAVVLNGELGRFDGIPIITSPVMRENLNASGYVDPTASSKTAILLVYRPAFTFGVRREMELKLFEDSQYDQMYLTGTGRYAFNTPWTTDPVVVAGVNYTA